MLFNNMFTIRRELVHWRWNLALIEEVVHHTESTFKSSITLLLKVFQLLDVVRVQNLYLLITHKHTISQLLDLLLILPPTSFTLFTSILDFFDLGVNTRLNDVHALGECLLHRSLSNL